MKDFPRKILVSPGYGAGWSSWISGSKEMVQFVAEYQPIIEFLENGGVKEDKEFEKLLEELENIIYEKFGISIYTGGAKNLVVKEVSGPYMIKEYDGSESIIEQENTDLWYY